MFQISRSSGENCSTVWNRDLRFSLRKFYAPPNYSLWYCDILVLFMFVRYRIIYISYIMQIYTPHTSINIQTYITLYTLHIYVYAIFINDARTCMTIYSNTYIYCQTSCTHTLMQTNICEHTVAHIHDDTHINTCSCIYYGTNSHIMRPPPHAI